MRRALITTGAAALLGAVALLSGAPVALADLVGLPPPSPPPAAKAPASVAPVAIPSPAPSAPAQPAENESIIVARVGKDTISAAGMP